MPIGNSIYYLRQFIRDPLLFMQNEHANRGDYFSLHLGHKKFHFLKHPNDIQHVLDSEVSHFRKSRLIFNKIKPITGENGLVQLEGENWQTMRGITSEVFHRQYLDRYVQIINEYTDDLITAFKLNPTIDAAAAMIHYTIKIAIKVFLGVENEAETAIIAKHFISLNHACGLRMRRVLNLPLLLPTSLNRQILYSRNEIKARIIKLIMLAKHGQTSLLSILKHALPDNPELIYDQLMTFIFAGYETSAASLTFSLYLLAKHPEWQSRIRESQQSEAVVAVYREALRLYPPAYMLAREVTHAHLMGEHSLRKADNVIISVRETHRHHDYWHESHSFLPERFLKTNPVKRHKFSFIPFGYGKRICSGMQLAMIEAEIVLTRVIQQFHFKLTDDADLPIASMVTLHPNKPVKLTIERAYDTSKFSQANTTVTGSLSASYSAPA